MSDTIARLQEIESRYQSLDPGPWAWRQSYGIGNRVHWALESPKSAADGRVVSYLAVLHHCYPESFGESVEDDPYLNFIAKSRDDIEWLCQQMRLCLPEPLDWDKAKAHLDYMQEAYEDIGPAGAFGISLTIMPLQSRYARGERTKWLYDDIMEVE